jgi:hypothetical protein
VLVIFDRPQFVDRSCLRYEGDCGPAPAVVNVFGANAQPMHMTADLCIIRDGKGLSSTSSHMSSQPLKSNNPFKSPSANDEKGSGTTNMPVPEKIPDDHDLTFGLEDLSLQPGSDTQLHVFYASTPDDAPPAYPDGNSNYPTSEKANARDPEHSSRDLPASNVLPIQQEPFPSQQSSGSRAPRSFLTPQAPASLVTSLVTPMSPPSRPPPLQYPYTPFPPTYLISNDRHLDRGFPPLPPPSELQPHPFVSHDINEGDWLRYVSMTVSYPAYVLTKY